MTHTIPIIDDYEYGSRLADTITAHGLDARGQLIKTYGGGEQLHVGIREFNLGRLAYMLARGTDRDTTSDSKHYNGLYREELDAVRQGGGPSDRYTYATSLYPSLAAEQQRLYMLSHGIAVYDPRFLEPVYHENWNGLHRFTIDPKNALVAVIHGSQDPRRHAADLVKNHPGIHTLDDSMITCLQGVKRDH